MSTNTNLKIPDDLVAPLNQAAATAGQSRHAFIITTLRSAVQRDDDLDPGIVIGFIELHSTEINPADVECPECGMPFERPHIGFIAGKTRPIPFGPVCHICATTD